VYKGLYLFSRVFCSNLTSSSLYLIIALKLYLEAVMSSDWLTVEEIATDLRIKQSTVREWIRQKKLKAAKFGRDYRIKRQDYEEFIAKHYNGDEDEQQQ